MHTNTILNYTMIKINYQYSNVLIFKGMFIAKISKGRTIKQYINGTMTAPVLYSFMWLVVFGGMSQFSV